jgi:hypothetical protein
LAALEEMAKKLPAINLPTGKKKGKKFKKILARKHNAHSNLSNIDGEVPSKLRRRHSEGSEDECVELVDVTEPEEDTEEIFIAENIEDFERSLDDGENEDEEEQPGEDSE